MSHTCHHPECSRPVPAKMWGCKEHWFALPKFLRDEIWPKQILRLGIAGRGYAKVDLRKDGRYKAVYVHTAVLTAFVGPKPDGCECAHVDGGLRNNRLSNLAWKTHRENEADKVRHGTKLVREKHWNWQGGISL